MTSPITENVEPLREIARRRRVRRLVAFGSAVNDEFDDVRSDIDLLVEFEDLEPIERANTYFALLADLEALFGRPVDLVERSALRNPIVQKSIEANHILVYDAA